MRPVQFPEANGRLSGGPAEAYGTADDVVDLPVCRTGNQFGDQIISCWRLTWRDRLRVLVSGKVWLRVLARSTHAPVAVDAKCPFDRIVG